MEELNGKQNERIRGLETNMGWVVDELKEIKTNHLFHMKEDIGILRKDLTSIKTDMASRPTWLITGIFSLTIGLIVYLLTT